ncbi:MAG: preprotein translocase subunit SecG [Rhodospirillaceae bacterium]|jgi:preprotein translocase subunit SecG|nr:preprotein translocase subunit SecG [Rhodospirillaceae bacterium]
MITVILVIHLLIAIGLVGVILIQRSEGGALGMGGGGGGGGGGFMTGRAAADLLTRTTGILATGFFITSISLAILANQSGESTSILDQGAAPITTPTVPAEPAAPVAK